jgi:polyisoprenyl-phosphate glycosyltransferase
MNKINDKQQRRPSEENAAISVVVPVFNNAESLNTLFAQMSEFETGLADKGLRLDLIFVDDGSSDGSYTKLLEIKERRPDTKLIKLTRNFGAVRAVRAGLRHAEGDALTLLAADLQDSLEKVAEMVECWQAGTKFVICVRSERHDPLLSRAFAALYYRILNRLVMRDYPKSGFDLMLLDKTMLPYLLQGGPLVAPQLTAYWLGFTPTVISAERPPRPHGRSSWTFSKRLKLFVDTITSFSVAPIRFLSAIGLITALISLAYGSYIFVSALLGNFEIPGFATLAILISFFSGLILLMLGIIGEYLWRIFAALDDRPESVIEETRL